MNEKLPPLPGQNKDEENIRADNSLIRVTVQGKHFYLDKVSALDLAATIIMTVKSVEINE